MAESYGSEKIAGSRNGLLYYIDAFNTKCYVSGSGVINDLVSSATASVDIVGFSSGSGWDFGTPITSQIIPDNTVLNKCTSVDSQGAIECYVRFTDSQQGIFGITGAISSNRIAYGRIPGTSAPLRIIGFHGGGDYFHYQTAGSGSGLIYENTWYHLIWNRISGSEVVSNHNVYINGEQLGLVDQGSNPSQTIYMNDIGAAATTIQIGQNGDGAISSDTHLKSFRIWDRPLTAEEASQHYKWYVDKYGI
jgi:hypothetical protein